MITRAAFESFLQQQGLTIVSEHEAFRLWHSTALAEKLENSVFVNLGVDVVPTSHVRHTLRKLGLTWDDFVKAVPTAA